MTETYTLLDKGTIAKPPLSDQYEQHYVTYTTPSPEDKAWDLYFAEASSPKGYYYALWRPHFSVKEEKYDYPIFHRLALEYNWKPVESRPIPSPKCTHPQIKHMGYSSIDKRQIYQCLTCREMVWRTGASIPPGKYEIQPEEFRRITERFFEAYPKLRRFGINDLSN